MVRQDKQPPALYSFDSNQGGIRTRTNAVFHTVQLLPLRYRGIFWMRLINGPWV